MLLYKKSALLSLLAQLEVKLCGEQAEAEERPLTGPWEANQMMNRYNIIYRNVQSLRKQINKL